MAKKSGSRRQTLIWLVVLNFIIGLVFGPSRALLAATDPVATANTEVVTIMHTNDMHGRLANVKDQSIGMA